MMLALLQLTRPYYSLPLSGGLIPIAAYAAGGDLSGLAATLTFAVLSLYGVLSAGYVLNDVCDINVDAINSPQRAIPDKRISRRAARMGAIVLFAIGLSLATLCGVRFFVLLTLVAAGLVLYDVRSKRWTLLKVIWAAGLTTSLYPLAITLVVAADTPRFNVLFIHPVWLFMTTLGYEMLKDIRDVKGDALAANPRRAEMSRRIGFLWAARGILAAASLLTLLPYLLGWCKTIYLVSALAAVGLAAASLFLTPKKAIPCIYASVFLITAGSLADLLVYGP